jgi:hypothetical protein
MIGYLSRCKVSGGRGKEQGIGDREQAFCRHDRPGQDVAWDGPRTTLVISKMKEQRANVYENKGSPWKTQGQSGNVYENTGTYHYETGMSLKIKGIKSHCSSSGR